MGLLRGLWNGLTALRNITFNLLFLVILIAIIVGIFSSETITVPSSTALVLNPSGVIVEQKQPVDPFTEILSDQEEETETLLRDILEAISEARDDDRIKAIVLQLDSLGGASMSMMQEIGAALDAFRYGGKPVYAVGSRYSQGQYYLAAHADEVILDSHSFGVFDGVFITGLALYPTYFAEALEKLKVTIHSFRVGKYKSAVEPYTRNSMSDEAKEESRVWLGDLWDAYADGIADRRGISREAFDNYTNRYDELLGAASGDGAQLAIDQGLVDERMSREDFESKMLGVVGRGEGGEFARIGFRQYLSTIRPPIPVPTPGASQIAVITAKGTILDGEQPAGTIGGETMAGLIERARENSSVKAVVVRIDSPGGSASASERIRSQLALTQRAGKPVVVSMSGAAASGGYWIAATSNKIFAQPTTITGSIGTFSILPTIENSLAEIGISTDGIGTTEFSGSLDVTRSLNPRFERMLQISVETTYRKFLNIVAEGREMSVEAVDDIAQGRVWSGQQALDRGLVDALGNLDDAVESAALLADVTDYEILRVEKTLTPREQFFQELANRTSALVRQGLGDWWVSIPGVDRVNAEMRALLDMQRQGGVFLHCMVCRVSQ